MESFFDFSLFLSAFLVLLAWTVFSKLHAHVQQINRIRDAVVPAFTGYPVIGLLPVLIGYLLFSPKHIPLNAMLLPIVFGMGEVFRKEGMFRLDGGWFKQVIVVFTKEAAEAVLNDTSELKKSDEYKYLRHFTGTGLLTASYTKWKKHRRVLSPAFNPRILDSFQPVMYEHSNVLVQKIKSQIKSQGTVSVEDLLAKCSLGVVTETAMGIKCVTQTEEDVRYVAAVREVLTVISKRIVTPWLWNEFIFRLTPSGRKVKKNMKIVHSFVRKIIRQKKAEVQTYLKADSTQTASLKCRPFLELLLLHNAYSKEEDRLTDEDIQDETLTFTFAGFDTVSITTSWTVYYLGLHPEVMKQAWHEVNSVLSGDMEREITVDDLKQMEYLENVIKETQRVRPAVVTVLRILRNDVPVGKVTLPRGSTVAIGVEELHNDPHVFPDGKRFDPDRFADAKINPFQFVPFSAGPRNCIGQRFAVLEMKTILSNMIRHLDWRSLDQPDDVLSNPDIVVRPHKPLRIRFVERH